jgi:dTDP-4-dehydrorhamnose 3,5-epimerase
VPLGAASLSAAPEKPLVVFPPSGTSEGKGGAASDMEASVFTDGPIDGVEVRKVRKFGDERGWLAELWRNDEATEKTMPAMCYSSISRPGVQRGPHEHVDQTDWFCFIGPSVFLVVLWDNRKSSPTYRRRMRIVAGEDDPMVVIVPQGVVHGYRNIGDNDGLVTNLPNRLFMGQGRKSPVDEIRHEDDPATIFRMDDA